MTTKPDTLAIITEVLVESGWTSFGGAAIALKTYQTAVGIKEGQAYLSRGDEYNRTLSGDYQSEGHNALGGNSILIPVNADADMVRKLAQKFAMGVDNAVSQTYAARLFRKGGQFDNKQGDASKDVVQFLQMA